MLRMRSDECEALREQLTEVERKRLEIESDLDHMKRAAASKEETISSLRHAFELEKNAKGMLEEQLNQEKLLTVSIQQNQEASMSLRQELEAIRSERDILQSDVSHLKLASERKEETVASLREGLKLKEEAIQQLQAEIDELRKAPDVSESS